MEGDLYMTKTKVIIIFLSIIGVVSLLTYLNYDKILNYFTNREWEIAGLIGSIELSNYLDICGTSSNFIVVGNDFIEGYSETTKKSFEKSIDLKSACTYSCFDYAIIAEKDSNNIYVIYENEVKWSKNIGNATILGAYINKNGYAAVIYSQAGYKSLIKVFSNNGEELFTNYLASTYAIDVAISNDNKTLAIAEIDTNGVHVNSKIKLIDMGAISENKLEKYDLDSNELITDIEFFENDELTIVTDSNVKVFKDGKIKDILKYDKEKILMVDIKNDQNIVAVKKEEDGIFNSKCFVCIYEFDDLENVKKYELEDVPTTICSLGNIIAIDTRNEIIFINTSGNFVKKCEYQGVLKDLKLMDEGNTAVLIFRNTAEFVKVGGI